MSGFSVDLGMMPDFEGELSPLGTRVPINRFDTRGNSFNPGALAGLGMASDFESELSPLGTRVPINRFDTRGGAFNPGALAASSAASSVFDRSRSSITNGATFVQVRPEEVARNGDETADTCEDSLFRNPDCSLKTVRVVGALLGGGLVAGLLIRRFAG